MWRRYRFESDELDYRPVKWPPEGPYWCSGYGEDTAVIVAYMPSDSLSELTDYWPEATNVDYDDCDEITYSERFSKPDWWNDD